MAKVLEFGRNHQTGKQFNRSLILGLILNRGPVSRLTLSRLTRLSPASLTILTGQLIDEGMLVEVGEEEEASGRAGRKSMALDLNPAAGRTLGVHITPRVIRIGLVNLKGEILDQERSGPPGPDPSETLARIIEASRNLLSRNNLTPQTVIGMGVGAVGLVDSEQGINLAALSLGWENVPIKRELEQALGLPVYADNNVRGMVMAESLFGYGRTHNFYNIAVIYIGLGVGCGLLVEGKLYRGNGGAAGEIGHTIVDPHGKLCYCGARGCLETVASEAAMVKEALEAAERNPDGILAQKLASSGEAPLIEQVIQAAEANDPAAVGIICRAGEALGFMVINLMKVLSPDTVILSGRVTRETPLFVNKVIEVVKSSGATSGPQLAVMTSTLSDDIGMVGAAALALNKAVYSPGQEPDGGK
jgi:N-acetylglucosamine repressor